MCLCVCVRVCVFRAVNELPAPARQIVNKDGSFNVIKLAIDYVWNLPRLADRLVRI